MLYYDREIGCVLLLCRDRTIIRDGKKVISQEDWTPFTSSQNEEPVLCTYSRWKRGGDEKEECSEALRRELGSETEGNRSLKPGLLKSQVFIGGQIHSSIPHGASGGHRTVKGTHGCQGNKLKVCTLESPRRSCDQGKGCQQQQMPQAAGLLLEHIHTWPYFPENKT